MIFSKEKYQKVLKRSARTVRELVLVIVILLKKMEKVIQIRIKLLQGLFLFFTYPSVLLKFVD
jgi:hypothetical protein